MHDLAGQYPSHRRHDAPELSVAVSKIRWTIKIIKEEAGRSAVARTFHQASVIAAEPQVLMTLDGRNAPSQAFICLACLAQCVHLFEVLSDRLNLAGHGDSLRETYMAADPQRLV